MNDNVKVVIGGGDQAVAAIGGGVTGTKHALCHWELPEQFLSQPTISMDSKNSLHSFCHANGRYHQMGVTLAAAASLKWWAQEVIGSENFDGLLAEAEEAAIEDSVFYLPYLMGERTPHNDPFCRGVFIGMNMTHQRKHLTRAVLEGVAFSLRDTFEIMKAMGIRAPIVRINGGGAKSKLWCKIISDVLNVKVEKLNTDEGPAYGAAILAAVGSGRFATVESACASFLKVTESIDPDETNVGLYNQKYKIQGDIPCNERTFQEVNSKLIWRKSSLAKLSSCLLVRPAHEQSSGLFWRILLYAPEALYP